jgi:hypothetical protein
MEYIALFVTLAPLAVIIVSLASKDIVVSPEQQRLDDEEQLRAISKA